MTHTGFLISRFQNRQFLENCLAGLSFASLAASLVVGVV